MEIVTNIEKLHEPTKIAEDGDKVLEIAKALFTEMEREREEIITMGLSANQLGFDLRICVMRNGRPSPICLVNPAIVKKKGSILSNELCLSLPGVVVNVCRPKLVKVKALNQYMKFVKYTFTGLDAKIACHEIDHLDGKLIIDY